MWQTVFIDDLCLPWEVAPTPRVVSELVTCLGSSEMAPEPQFLLFKYLVLGPQGSMANLDV